MATHRTLVAAALGVAAVVAVSGCAHVAPSRIADRQAGLGADAGNAERLSGRFTEGTMVSLVALAIAGDRQSARTAQHERRVQAWMRRHRSDIGTAISRAAGPLFSDLAMSLEIPAHLMARIGAAIRARRAGLIERLRSPAQILLVDARVFSERLVAALSADAMLSPYVNARRDSIAARPGDSR